jgi:uncharacterized sulfatase
MFPTTRFVAMFLITLASLFACRLADGAPPNESTRPNILWIIAEDLSPDLGCYGAPLVKTPHIDGLAAQGVRYTNVFGISSVCAVNRSALAVGMYATSIGAHPMRVGVKRPLPDGVRPIPEYCREAGYFVSNGAGHGNLARPLTKPGKVDWGFKIRGRAFDGTDWSQRKPGQPFFARINTSETHRPWTPDRQDPIDPAKVVLPPYYPDHPLVRCDWASYLEEAQILDRKVGAVLKRLDDEGLADNTIVFFFGDNGRPFCRGKGYLYEGGLKVPLIIRWPDGRRAGTVDDRLISMIDFSPSVLKMAGIDLPGHMHGRPLIGAKEPGREAVFAAKDRLGTVSDRVRCVRTTRYKYVRNFFPEKPYLPANRYSLMMHPSLAALLVLAEQGKLTRNQAPFAANSRPAEELYDLKADPHELHNLADDPAHPQTLIELRGKLDQWIEETDDQGRRPESEESITAYRRFLDQLVAKTLADRGLDKLDATTMYDYWMRHYKLSKP